MKAEALRAKLRRMEEEELASETPPEPSPTGYRSIPFIAFETNLFDCNAKEYEGERVCLI